MNFYEILEVSPNASPEVIKVAYKSLMQRYHPDRNPDSQAAARAVRIAQAHEVLSDAIKRAAYDNELRLKQVSLITSQEYVRDMVQRSTAKEKPDESFLSLWLVVVTIVLAGWLFLSVFKKQHLSDMVAQAVQGGVVATDGKLADPQSGVASRTVPHYVTNLTVRLIDTNTQPNKPDGAAHLLTIPRLDVVVGTFDSDKFMQNLEGNKDYIERRLAENLVDAEYAELIKKRGEAYLKSFILDALGEITGANRFEKYPSPDGIPARNYGAVDVMLPESYILQ